MAEPDPFWAHDDDPRPGASAGEIAEWERVHGVTLPGPLRDALARRDGGAVRGADVEINRLAKIQPVDDESWNWAYYEGDEPADRSLVFELGWRLQYSARYLVDFNARGREAEPSVHVLVNGAGAPVEDVADSLAEFFQDLRATEEESTVAWPEAWDGLDVLANETIDEALDDEEEASTLEQALVRHGDDLVLWTRQRDFDGEERTRTLLPAPLDANWADVKPFRPGPDPTFALHLQPVESEGIVCETSERRDDDGWRNGVLRGAPIYQIFESRDRERLEALRARLLGPDEDAAARDRERRDVELQARLDGLSPEARHAAVMAVAEKLREETDRLFRERHPDPSDLPPELRALGESLDRKVQEAFAKARDRLAADPPDPELLKLLEESFRPPDPGRT